MDCSKSICTLAQIASRDQWWIWRPAFRIEKQRPVVQYVNPTLVHKSSVLCAYQKFLWWPVVQTSSCCFWQTPPTAFSFEGGQVLCHRQCVPVNGTSNFHHHWFWTRPYHRPSGNLEHFCWLMVGCLFPRVQSTCMYIHDNEKCL